jgi:hypothetical protein
MKNSRVVIFTLLLSIIWMPLVMHAQTPDVQKPGFLIVCDNTPQNPCDFTALMVLAVRVMQLLIYGVAPVVGIAAFIYAGWLYLTAGADTKQAEKARDIFRDVVIGFAIVLAAWLLVYTIVNEFIDKRFDLPIRF